MVRRVAVQVSMGTLVGSIGMGAYTRQKLMPVGDHLHGGGVTAPRRAFAVILRAYEGHCRLQWCACVVHCAWMPGVAFEATIFLW